MRQPRRVASIWCAVALWTGLSTGVASVVAATSHAVAPEPSLEAFGDQDGTRTRLELSLLAPGDRLFIAGGIDESELPELDLGQWQRADNADSRWEIVATRPASARLELESALLVPGGSALVGVDRQLGEGVVLQVSRSVVALPDGGIVLGPAAVAEIRRGFRIETGDVSLPAAAGVRRDGNGRWLVDVTDPSLLALLAVADVVEPYVTATVRAAGTSLVLDSVTATANQNANFGGYLCNNYFGSGINITTAPGGSTITQLDVSYDVVHSIDISRFNVALFRWTGSNYGDALGLYQGSQSGSTTLSREHTGVTAYNGGLVNNQYLLGCCNRVALEGGYLDRWTLTLYYGASATIDLVADSISVSPSSIAAGGSVAAVFQGHVAGSGTVGSSFSIGFYLSTDATITTGDTLLRSESSNWASNPGDVFGYGSPGVTLTIPASVAPGSYYVGMILDRTGLIAESNEGNNVVWDTLVVASSADKPNLQAVSCSVWPTSVSAGGSVTFTWRGRNAGSVGSSDFVWFAYRSTDSSIQPGVDTGLYGLDAPGGWNAGYDTGDVSNVVDMPSGLASGTYYLGIYLDSSNQVAESNESDNSCSVAVTVGSGGGTTIRWLIPASASSPGVGSSNWKTQIAVVNPSSSSRTATVHFVAKGAAWPGVILSGPHTIAANRSLFLDDPLLPLNPTSGLVYIDVSSADLRVTSRTYNLASGGATYGQGIPAIRLDCCTAATEMVIPLAHSGGGRFRTNLGLVQTSAGSYQVEVTIRSQGGTLLATKTYTRSQAYEQITNVFSDMGLGSAVVEGAWMRLRLVSGTPQYWMAYASIVDEVTGDPTYVAAIPQ